MLCRLTRNTALQVRTSTRVLEIFRAHTQRLALISVTVLFVEIGLLRNRDRG
jgi:hypothetical protein